MPKRRKVDAVLDGASLEGLLHRGGISAAGLAEVLAAIGSIAGGESAVRAAICAANRAKYDDVRHCFDVPLIGGGQKRWAILDPSKLLDMMLTESEGLQTIYANALGRFPSTPESPWRLVVAFDEFTPGNKLSADHSRKTMVLSFTFMEVGQAALSRGVAWCTAVCVRTHDIEQAPLLRHRTDAPLVASPLHGCVCTLTRFCDSIQRFPLSGSPLPSLYERAYPSVCLLCRGNGGQVCGGWSCMLRCFCERILLGPSGLATAGMTVTVRGRPYVLFARLSNLLSDGDGLRQVCRPCCLGLLARGGGHDSNTLNTVERRRTTGRVRAA